MVDTSLRVQAISSRVRLRGNSLRVQLDIMLRINRDGRPEDDEYCAVGVLAKTRPRIRIFLYEQDC
jgi:hypothetical protein